jgi:hypothetical protein
VAAVIRYWFLTFLMDSFLWILARLWHISWTWCFYTRKVHHKGSSVHKQWITRSIEPPCFFVYSFAFLLFPYIQCCYKSLCECLPDASCFLFALLFNANNRMLTGWNSMFSKRRQFELWCSGCWHLVFCWLLSTFRRNPLSPSEG